jgi:hypothetical protein
VNFTGYPRFLMPANRTRRTIAASSKPSSKSVDACLEGSLGLGELTVLPSRLEPIDDGHEALPAPPRSPRRNGHVRGFDVHAGVVVGLFGRATRAQCWFTSNDSKSWDPTRRINTVHQGVGSANAQ